MRTEIDLKTQRLVRQHRYIPLGVLILTIGTLLTIGISFLLSFLGAILGAVLVRTAFSLRLVEHYKVVYPWKKGKKTVW